MGPSGDMKAEFSQKRVVGLVSKETHLEFTMKPRGKLHDNGRVVELRRSPLAISRDLCPDVPRCQWPHGGRVSPALLSLATA